MIGDPRDRLPLSVVVFLSFCCRVHVDRLPAKTRQNVNGDPADAGEYSVLRMVGSMISMVFDEFRRFSLRKSSNLYVEPTVRRATHAESIVSDVKPWGETDWQSHSQGM